MKLIASKSIKEKYPDLRIAIVVAKHVENTKYLNGIESFVNESFMRFAEKFNSPQEFEENKNIISWRNIYRSFGVNPKKRKPTAEALLLRTVKNRYVPRINPAVDAYLSAQTLHCLPVGGYDLERISGDIILRNSSGNEEFLGVGSDNSELTIDDEIVYADASRILTRCWNYRDCDYSKISTETRTLALFSEAPISDISDNEVKETVVQIAENLERFCEAQCSVLFLDSNESEIVIL